MKKMRKINYKGFTLLEILIALALSSLVMLALVGGVNIVLRDWERANNRLEINLDNSLILLQIERALTGAIPHTYLNRKQNQLFVYFEGEEKELRWASTIQLGEKSGLSIWRLSPAEKNEGLALQVIPALAGDPTENIEEAEKITIFANYTTYFQYLYLDQTFNGKETKWHDEWSGEKQRGLPDAVRIRLEKTTGIGDSLEIIAMILANQHATIPRIKP